MNQVIIKGAVVAVLQHGARVEVWVASPTGDSSDSHIYTIPCISEAQAQTVAEMWKNAMRNNAWSASL